MTSKYLLRLCLLAYLCLGLLSTPLWAQVATSFYTPVQFMQSLESKWQQPSIQNFLQQSTQQTETVQAFCNGKASLKAAQQSWQQTVKSWEYLSSIAIGPVLQRRSTRQIDFTPTRPRSIQQAIQTQPQDAHAMQLIGSPAKGFPALEWLLWQGTLQANTPACNYAQQVAADIQREAQALSTPANPTSQEANKSSEEGDEANTVSHALAEKASANMAEFINQWIGALERLRWANIEKPLRSAQKANPEYPRNLSHSSELAWQAEWAAIRDLALEHSAQQHISLETYMRGRGLLTLAEQLHQLLLNTDKSMKKIRAADKSTVTQATQQLAKLKKFAEQDMASALQVNIGFSDADGD